jgi:hypothetical protein
VHDFFDVIGLPSDASVGEVRRCARRARRLHPDFRTGSDPRPFDPGPDAVVPRDAAVEFIDAGTLFDRIESAFLGREG